MIKKIMQTINKKLIIALGVGVLIFGPLFVLGKPVSAAYQSNNLISDSNFTNVNSMGVAAIQTHLLNVGSYLASYHAVENCGSTGGAHYSFYAAHYNCGHSVLASQIIYDAAHAYSISPRVIIATLQKEQSLITDPSPSSSQLNCAMGYNSCGGFVGFFSQVDNGTWQFKTYLELMNGRAWWGYSPSSYPCNVASEFYNKALKPGNDVTFYDYDHTAYTHFIITNSSTAAMYCYTPHVYPGSSKYYYSGSYNFVYWYELWWGSTTGPCTATANIPATASGRDITTIRRGPRGADALTQTRQNNTGSFCAEDHVWNPGYSSWNTHITTNLSSVDPTNSRIIAGNMSGNGVEELMFVKYQSGNGHVEVHTWDSTYKNWAGHVVTALGNINPSDGEIITGDMNGDGHDELLFVKYNGTGGHTEVHTFASDYHSWAGHALTMLTGFNPANGSIMTADTNGDGRDELLFVKYSGTGGHTEVHTFASDYHSWAGHALTMLNGFDPSKNKIAAGDMDGNSHDELLYIKIMSTGSGKVEVHTMSPDYHSWASHSATNLSTYDPAT